MKNWLKAVGVVLIGVAFVTALIALVLGTVWFFTFLFGDVGLPIAIGTLFFAGAVALVKDSMFSD